jgi:hypothetical protein
MEENEQRLHDRIHLHELPRTFRDAVLLCKRLDIHFLWIDSLCILQQGKGSEEDWRKHVVEMRDISRNCFVDVAASHAPDPNQDLYTERNLDHIKHWRLYSVGDGNTPKGDFSLVHHTINKYNLEHDPLNTRGWV